MKHRLHWIFAPYLAAAGAEGSTTDRGDNYTPPADEDEGKKPPVKAEKPDTDSDLDPDDPDGEKAKAAAAAAAAEAAKNKEPKDDKAVPLSRHKEILQKERAAREEAEKKLAQFQGGDRIKATNDEIKKIEAQIDDKQTEYDKAIADGDLAKAKVLQKEIRSLGNDASDRKMALVATASEARAVERVRYDVTVERLEAAYPVLNPEHEGYDEDAAQDVMDLAQTYQGRGLTPSAAIQKAAKKLLGAETAKQEKAVEVAPRVDAESEEVEKARIELENKNKETVETERRKKAVDKNVDAAKKQPADTSKVGADHDKSGGSITAKDVLKMDYKDFVKLDDETLARMRGDVIGA